MKRKSENFDENQQKKMKKNQTATQIKRRREKARINYHLKKANETAQDREANKEKRKLRKCNESQVMQSARRSKDQQYRASLRANESEDQRSARLESDRRAHSQQRSNVSSNESAFRNSVNQFANQICEICKKQCYPNQITSHNLGTEPPQYLPNELLQKSVLKLCHRCKCHLSSKKRYHPPKAYWNNLDPGIIPTVIEDLSQAEQRLLSRMIPFVKIVKFDGIFGQFGFKGQAILFAQDLFEVTEKLPNMLPRSVDDTDLIIVTEHLENLNVSREFTVSRQKVYAALNWLIANNPLYSDVIIDESVIMNEEEFIRISHEYEEDDNDNDDTQSQDINLRTNHATSRTTTFEHISDGSRILRASWHQANMEIFTRGNAGIQCCAMSLANIVRAAIISPRGWTENILNMNLIEGDNIYEQIRILTEADHQAFPIGATGYLTIRNFDVIKQDFIMFNQSFSIEYNEEQSLNGSLHDQVNEQMDNFGMTLRMALQNLFMSHNAGILISSSKAVAVMKYDDKFYIADSHSCGPKGSVAVNGKACIIECDTFEELHRICKRSTGSRNIEYNLFFIDVQPKDDILINEEIHNLPSSQAQPIIREHTDYPLQIASEIIQESQTESIPIQTSLMAAIDSIQPDVEDEIELADNINQIKRKTKDNIVNINHEKRAEEFAWFHLFPYGRNGLNEIRDVKITPLDYYQYRLLGNDLRYQRNDYLFYALSVVEYHRIKSAIAACGKKIEGPDGRIEDIHLYLKNLRGSAAYWKTALNELIAQIRCLGPPTYFITFSCNDLNWIDMRKALLIADGRPNDDPNDLTLRATQLLIEKYPIVVSRHFMVRVNALMKFIKSDSNVFGGLVQDFWWRIEFQNRGSPHLHMVVWIANHPEFDTPEGLRLLDQVCKCELPNEDSEIYDIVRKCQTHHHTNTCTKNTNATCRFSFPRQICEETRIISHSSDEFIRNGGRICLLRRRVEDVWINNYNPTLLKIWNGNIDIQPCGSNEAIAYYIAKYISKSEPTDLESSLGQAIRQIRQEDSNVAQKVFKICMKIMNERQVSGCECAYRLCHLKLKESSRRCIFLNTRKPEQRYKVLQFDSSGQATGYCANIFERYEKRPNEHPNYDFQNMSLMEFAMQFEPYYSKPQLDEECIDEDVYDSEPKTRKQLITLTDNSKMLVRNIPAVIRTPYFTMQTDPENYFYSLLVQYLPYRTENELLMNYNSARESFLAHEETLREQNGLMDLHRERNRQLESAFNQVHAFNILEEVEPVEMIENEDIPEISMNETEFSAACTLLNVGQREIFNKITLSIQNQMSGTTIDRERLFVTGGAGTGKTFLFNLLKNQVNRCYGKPSVKVCSLTGVAARLVGGSTMHSLFKFPVQKDGKIVRLPHLTGNYLRIMRLQWNDIRFLFIDEISMVPYEMLCMIDFRLKQLKNNEQIFGGINILLFGDLLQLPPVRGSQVFEQPARMLPATNLWRIFTLVELQENMRQRGQTTFQEILNALRVGEIKPQHLAVLMSKVSNNFTGEFSIERALRIYPTKKQVDDHNLAVLNHFRENNTVIFKIKAQDQLIDNTRRLDDQRLENVTPVDINKTGGLPKEIEIFVGAKVMLRSNIEVSKGLVNGAIGIITEIIWPYFRRGQLYDTDIPSVRVDFGQEGIHLIQPKAIQFQAKYSYGTIERRMLPIILSWASTVHKMQGSTVEFAVIYLGSKLFADGQAYVALGRVRSLDGVMIEELDCSKLTGKTPCNKKALKEMQRMRNK